MGKKGGLGSVGVCRGLDSVHEHGWLEGIFPDGIGKIRGCRSGHGNEAKKTFLMVGWRRGICKQAQLCFLRNCRYWHVIVYTVIAIV